MIYFQLIDIEANRERESPRETTTMKTNKIYDTTARFEPRKFVKNELERVESDVEKVKKRTGNRRKKGGK